jgi:hypothetical protein
MDDGLKIDLSPVQLAAAFADKTVTEAETASNRLFGGLAHIMAYGCNCVVLRTAPTGLTNAKLPLS